MKLQGKVVVTGLYTSQKSGKTYMSLVDLDTGGQFQLGFEDQPEVRVGSMLNLDIVVNARQYGRSLSLEYISGVMQKI